MWQVIYKQVWLPRRFTLISVVILEVELECKVGAIKVPLYESVYITRPDISAAQVESLTEDLTKIIEENGGKVTKDEYWGLKSLAYKIKKNRKAHYSLLNIDAPSAAISEMERNMRIHEDVLRYLSIRVDEHEEGPSIMMQNKTTRDERDRGRDLGGAEKYATPEREGVTEKSGPGVAANKANEETNG